MNVKKEAPVRPEEIEGLNEAQQKILHLCFYKAQNATELMRLLDKDSGYIWKLCERLKAKGYLNSFKSQQFKKYYRTNKDKVIV